MIASGKPNSSVFCCSDHDVAGIPNWVFQPPLGQEVFRLLYHDCSLAVDEAGDVCLHLGVGAAYF